jgi:hypothetical protein
MSFSERAAGSAYSACVKRLLGLVPVVAVVFATAFASQASAAKPTVITLGQQNRHPTMTFSAPRASSVSVDFARSRDRATDGTFLSENVVHSDYLTDDEVQTGRWLDESQLDPGKYFVLLSVSAESSCWSYPPPDYDGVLDPSCADGFSDVAVLEIPKPSQRFTARTQQLRYARVFYLTLKVSPLGEELPYKVCWRRKTKRRVCVSSEVSGYDWNSSADDMVRISSRAMSRRTTFTWFVGAQKVASKTVRVLRP